MNGKKEANFHTCMEIGLLMYFTTFDMIHRAAY